MFAGDSHDLTKCFCVLDLTLLEFLLLELLDELPETRCACFDWWHLDHLFHLTG